MKKFVLMLFLLGVIFLASCNSDEQIDSFTKTGTVVSINANDFLVVDGAKIDDINRMSSQEIIDKYENGVWFSFEPEKQETQLESGMKVKVWYDAMEDSLPGYGSSVEIHVQ